MSEHQNDREKLDPIQFNEPKQRAIVGYLLVNERFFTQGYGKIHPEWFNDADDTRIVQAKYDFYAKYKRIPSVEELQNLREFLLEDVKTKNRIYARVKLCIAETTNFGLDAITPELTEWMHARIFHSAAERALVKFNAKKISDAVDIQRKAMREIEDTEFTESPEVNFENFRQDFERAEAELKDTLTFGLTKFDKLLTPEATHGSLLRGDTTVLLAPTNVGKTTTMITIAGANIMAGKHVLLISHEGRPEDITQKIWCNILGVTRAELLKMYKDPTLAPRMQWGLNWIKKFLVYLPMNKAGLTVEEVEARIRTAQEEHIVKTNGRGFDMLIDDYPAKLVSKEFKGGNNPRRVVDDYVYNIFVQLGLEYKFHTVVAIQTNREGSKVNRHEGKEQRLLAPEDVMEAFGPMTSATNIISINRDPIAEAREYVTFNLCKSRSSKKGVAVLCKSDYARAKTHSNELGCTWYTGNNSPTGKVMDYLAQHATDADEVPTDAWIEV